VRVVLTGASGFIGRALAAHLRGRGDEVVGLDLRAGDGVAPADVTRPGPWQDVQADVVIHAAAYVGFNRRDPAAVWRVNTLGARHALEAAARAGARLVHLSSVSVFGFDFEDGVDETAPVRPTGIPYVDTKIAAEQVVLQAHAAGEAEVTVVRPGDVYGPESDAWAVRPAQALRARRLLLPRGIFSPVYVGDLVEGIAAAARGPAGRVYTLAGGTGVPNERYFGPIAALVGRRPPIVALPVALAAARVGERLRLHEDVNPLAVRYFTRRGTYSVARAREELGWEPRTTLEDGLERTCAWLRESGVV
jgi:nucleoside-diphosphate-sugar epimerase